MNQFLTHLTTEFLIPLASMTVITALGTLIPFITMKINKWLKVKLQIEQDLLTKEQDDFIEKQAEKWIRYAEEVSRKKISQDGISLPSIEKLSLVKEKLKSNDSLKGLDDDALEILIHSVLNKLR